MKTMLTGLLLLASGITFSQTTAIAKTIKVNEQRLENRILELAKFGKDSSGSGYRVAFTKGDIEARAWYISLMKKRGLK